MNTRDANLEPKSAARKIRVLVVDDSALARRAISDALAAIRTLKSSVQPATLTRRATRSSLSSRT